MTPASSSNPNDVNESYAFIEKLKGKDSELLNEFESKYGDNKEKALVPEAATGRKTRAIVNNELETLVTESPQPNAAAPELKPESIVAHFRPVLIIRDNQVVPEFVGDEVEVWKTRIMDKADVLNRVIPSVGRVEVNNNAIYNWVGTGWLVDKDIIVTNRHVASLFCQNKAGFTFKIGYPSGLQSAKMDFLEEDQRTSTLEFNVDYVIWIAPNDNVQPDVAFMRLKPATNGKVLPKPIPLASTVDEGEIVVTIGYPARDPDFPDQELAQNVFKNVYDKKRLAPGEISKVGDTELEHDCSTLGGNSGSAVVSLASGEAVGLHFAGIYMRTNYAVPAPTINGLLGQLKKGTLPGMRKNENVAVADDNTAAPTQTDTTTNPPGTYTMELNIPIKITVEVGGTVVHAALQNQALQNVLTGGSKATPEQALEAARKLLDGRKDIREVRLGYKFRNGWITNERAIVVEVPGDKDLPTGIPPDFGGIAVDIRKTDLLEQLEDMNADLRVQEAVPRAGGYKEPPGLKLEAVKEKMDAIFHVSPDSGFPNLHPFIERITSKLTATIYEWEINHISDALSKAILKAKGSLKMVTQKPGTKDAVADMQKRLKKRFEHQFASVGSGKLFPTAYHIKVASRDEEEFWLSSGNWKDSNQADIDPAGDKSKSITPLRQHNREWHAIIKNKKLAVLFREFIDWDFDEAQRVPLEEAVEAPPVWLIVPEEEEVLEARVVAKYFDPLFIKNRVLDIQPLLTPDRDDRGRRMFMVFATDLIQGAQSSISIENQSFNLLAENNDAFERFFTVLKNKQDSGVALQVIYRDLREFHNSNMKLIETLKEFGINTDIIKVQKKCHTKAIIIDPEDPERAAVLFGSHNLTNSGALFNRDASLLVRDMEVTQYFKKIFDFDYATLATQDLGDGPANVRVAAAGEEAPPGFKKVLLNSIVENM